MVGVTATADRTPGVARTSASAACGRPAAELDSDRSCDRPACRSARTAWSWVVVLNSSVQLKATVSTSGVIAEEKRRVAVFRLADARKPPTGEIAENGGRRTPAITRATTGPRKPTAVTRNSAVIPDGAAAVGGLLVGLDPANSGGAPAGAISPPITRPLPTLRGSMAASASALVGATRDTRRPAAMTAISATATPLPTAPAIGSQPALTE